VSTKRAEWVIVKDGDDGDRYWVDNSVCQGWRAVPDAATVYATKSEAQSANIPEARRDVRVVPLEDARRDAERDATGTENENAEMPVSAAGPVSEDTSTGTDSDGEAPPAVAEALNKATNRDGESEQSKTPDIAGIHPYALLLSEVNRDILTDWAADIAQNGLRDPIVVTPAGLIIDGRNRWEACKLAGVKPTVEVFDGDDHDIAKYIQSKNIYRRNLTPGQKAMSAARVLHADGCRDNGRWVRGSVVNPDNPTSGITESKTWQNDLSRAGTIIDYAPELAADVAEGAMAIGKAFLEAETKRDPKKKKPPKPKPAKQSSRAVRYDETLSELKKTKTGPTAKISEVELAQITAIRRECDRIINNDINGIPS
jgi:hypothetical protein